MNFLAIDFETASYGRDSACAVGLVRVEKGVIIRKESHLIRPPSREFVFTLRGLIRQPSSGSGSKFPTSSSTPEAP